MTATNSLRGLAGNSDGVGALHGEGDLEPLAGSPWCWVCSEALQKQGVVLACPFCTRGRAPVDVGVQGAGSCWRFPPVDVGGAPTVALVAIEPTCGLFPVLMENTDSSLHPSETYLLIARIPSA